MSLQQIARILWARRWIILICFATIAIAGMFAAAIRPKTYTAEARVMLDVLKPDPVTGEVISTSFARAFVPTQTELIRDYRVTGRVVDKLGWTRLPWLKAEYDDSNKDGVDFRRWLATRVSDSTNAYNVTGSNVIVVSYTASDPQTAAKMADLVREAYVEETIASKRSDAAGTAKWFERQLADVRAKLVEAESRKVAFERANNIVLMGDDTDADSARLQALSNQASPPTTITSGGVGGGAELAKLAEIDARISAQSATLGPNHPVIQDLRRQRAELAAAASRARSSGGGTIVTGPSVGAEVAQARTRVLAQRDKVEEARRLQADLQVLREQYAKMTARAADLFQQANSSESGITLMDSAIPPQDADPPKASVILIGALGLGLGLGVMIALFIELLHRRVRAVEDLNAIGVPVIGIIHGNQSFA